MTISPTLNEGTDLPRSTYRVRQRRMGVAVVPVLTLTGGIVATATWQAAHETSTRSRNGAIVGAAILLVAVGYATWEGLRRRRPLMVLVGAGVPALAGCVLGIAEVAGWSTFGRIAAIGLGALYVGILLAWARIGGVEQRGATRRDRTPRSR